jgi:hypothetical protein
VSVVPSPFSRISSSTDTHGAFVHDGASWAARRLSCGDWLARINWAVMDRERIFHEVGDAFYIPTHPERCFTSAEEAESAAYRAALR